MFLNFNDDDDVGVGWKFAGPCAVDGYLLSVFFFSTIFRRIVRRGDNLGGFCWFPSSDSHKKKALKEEWMNAKEISINFSIFFYDSFPLAPSALMNMMSFTMMLGIYGPIKRSIDSIYGHFLASLLNFAHPHLNLMRKLSNYCVPHSKLLSNLIHFTMVIKWDVAEKFPLRRFFEWILINLKGGWSEFASYFIDFFFCCFR